MPAPAGAADADAGQRVVVGAPGTDGDTGVTGDGEVTGAVAALAQATVAAVAAPAMAPAGTARGVSAPAAEVAAAAPPHPAAARGTGAAGSAPADATPAAVERPRADLPQAAAAAVEALQRVIERRADAGHGETSPAGLENATARLAPDAGAAGTSAGGSSMSDGRDLSGQDGQRRPARGVIATAPLPAATPAPAAAAKDGAFVPATPAEAAGAAWRAALARVEMPAAPGGDHAAASPAAPRSAVLPPTPVAVPLPEVASGPVEVAMPAPLGEAADAEPVHTQIVRSLRMQWTGAAGEVRVSLKPAYLGEVVASIKVEQGIVTATLQADTPEVRRMLEAQAASLRDALGEHGLKLDRLVIAEPESQGQAGAERRSRGRQPQTPTPRPRRRQASGDPTFDLTTE
ncbi:MAG: flagellar hook-length control protein FliK [Vicinamibacterales bacterium]